MLLLEVVVNGSHPQMAPTRGPLGDRGSKEVHSYKIMQFGAVFLEDVCMNTGCRSQGEMGSPL